MSRRVNEELQDAREAYRMAMRRYGESATQEARLAWMRAQKRLAEAVCANLGIPL